MTLYVHVQQSYNIRETRDHETIINCSTNNFRSNDFLEKNFTDKHECCGFGSICIKNDSDVNVTMEAIVWNELYERDQHIVLTELLFIFVRKNNKQSAPTSYMFKYVSIFLKWEKPNDTTNISHFECSNVLFVNTPDILSQTFVHKAHMKTYIVSIF